MSELDVLEWFMSAFSALDGVMEGITLLATNWLIWLVIAFLLTCFKDYRRTGIAVIVALVVTYIVTDLVMKPLIDRPRPFEVSDIIPLIDPPTSASFPSGHTASSFAAATVLFMRDRRLGIPSYVFAALVGISRLCLGVHWPTDVLAGAVIGAILAYACVKLLYGYIPYFRDGEQSEEG